MWWNGPGPGWGPMYGWWIMPVFGVLFLIIVLLIVSRFFGGGTWFCNRPPADKEKGIEELRKEIKALRDEIKELKEKGHKGNNT